MLAIGINCFSVCKPCRDMKQTEKNWKLAGWNFMPDKNPVGKMATIHIPTDRISWFAHSADKRLDIGLDGSVIHLLQRDSNKDAATDTEMARSRFNKVGSAYWIEEDVNELYEKLDLKWLIKCKVKDSKDRETVEDLTNI